jgi:N utilization substance protein B
MAERTARARAADKGRQWIKVKDGKLSGPDPAVELVGTSLSAALANAQAAESGAADASRSAESGAAGTSQSELADPGNHVAGSADAGGAPAADAVASGTQAADANAQQPRADSAAPPAAVAAAGTRPADAGGGDPWPEGRSQPQGSPSKSQGTSAKPPGWSTKPTSAATNAKHAFAAARSVARKLALQAIYRWQLNDAPWQDLVKEFGEAEDMPNADPKYFRELVEGVWASRQSLDERLAELVDRPVEQLDPVEHSVLLIGLYELSAKPEVPYRVAINEAVGLAKRFGATDGHKFVNAVLDRAARTLRPGEN